MIILVSYDLLRTASVRRVVRSGGHGWDVCIRTKKREQWRIVRVCIFLSIAYCRRWVRDSWCCSGHLLICEFGRVPWILSLCIGNHTNPSVVDSLL